MCARPCYTGEYRRSTFLSSLIDYRETLMNWTQTQSTLAGALFLVASTLPAQPLLPINAIQGPDSLSPRIGERVMIEGVVSANYLAVSDEEKRLSGFFVMEDPVDRDDDPMTSEGIFIYAPDLRSPAVAVGDRVRVSGTVVEYTSSGGLSSLTELSSGVEDILHLSSGAPPTPVAIAWPEDGVFGLERYEGMLVRITTPMTIIENRNLDLFGEYRLAPPAGRPAGYVGGRRLQPTSFLPPGSEAYALGEEQAEAGVIFDDGDLTRLPDLSFDPLRTGSVAENLVAIVDDRFGARRLLRVPETDQFEAAPRPEGPPEFEDVDGLPGGIRVASFNLGNYFLTLDTADGGCGPERSIDCRGAGHIFELGRQRTKLVAALAGLRADLIGLIEVENTTGIDAIGDLVKTLNFEAGEDRYAAVETGLIGTDAIRVGIIYRADRLEILGEHAILDQSLDPRFLSGSNRPSLAQTFRTLDNGGVFTLVVNHFKSKGSDCDRLSDPDLLDGQGNCNETRTAAAEALVDWLRDDPTGSGDRDVLVVGDFNAYQREDPISAIVRGSDDTLETEDDFERLDLRAPLSSLPIDYTYAFNGMVGALDHAFVSGSLLSQVRGAGVWHINSDEPDIYDYTIGDRPPSQIALYRPDPFRSSDHDPIVVGLLLQGDSAKVGVEDVRAAPDRLDLSRKSRSLFHGRVDVGTRNRNDPGDLDSILVLPGELEEDPG